MDVSSVTLFLTRKISGFSAGDFVKHQFYNLCVLCKQIAMATMLKITFFFNNNNQNAGLYICLLLFSFIQYHSVLLLFYVFTFKIFKIVFMSKIWQYRCILSFLFSLHTIIS